MLGARDPRVVSGKGPARLHHCPDHGLSPGSQESPASREKISTALIFEATVSRQAAERRLIDDLLSLFGGRTRPVMAHLIESGKLTLRDVREAEKTLRKLEGGDKTR